ncbi:hypothetical protein PCE1_004352 [Barthelona sp. PCE]
MRSSHVFGSLSDEAAARTLQVLKKKDADIEKLQELVETLTLKIKQEGHSHMIGIEAIEDEKMAELDELRTAHKYEIEQLKNQLEDAGVAKRGMEDEHARIVEQSQKAIKEVEVSLKEMVGQYNELESVHRTARETVIRYEERLRSEHNTRKSLEKLVEHQQEELDRIKQLNSHQIEQRDASIDALNKELKENNEEIHELKKVVMNAEATELLLNDKIHTLEVASAQRESQKEIAVSENVERIAQLQAEVLNAKSHFHALKSVYNQERLEISEQLQEYAKKSKPKPRKRKKGAKKKKPSAAPLPVLLSDHEMQQRLLKKEVQLLRQRLLDVRAIFGDNPTRLVELIRLQTATFNFDDVAEHARISVVAENWRSRCELLEREISDLTAQVEKLSQTKASDVESMRIESKSVMRESNERLQKAIAKAARLESDLENMRFELNRVKEESTRQRSILKNYKTQIKALESEVSSLNAKNVTLEAQSLSAKPVLGQLQQELDQRRSEIDKLKSAVHRHRIRAESNEKKCEGLQASIKEKETTAQRTEKKNNSLIHQLRRNIKEHQLEIMELKSDTSRYDELTSIISVNKTKYEDKLKKYKAEISTLKTALDTANREILLFKENEEEEESVDYEAIGNQISLLLNSLLKLVNGFWHFANTQPSLIMDEYSIPDDLELSNDDIAAVTNVYNAQLDAFMRQLESVNRMCMQLDDADSLHSAMSSISKSMEMYALLQSEVISVLSEK